MFLLTLFLYLEVLFCQYLSKKIKERWPFQRKRNLNTQTLRRKLLENVYVYVMFSTVHRFLKIREVLREILTEFTRGEFQTADIIAVCKTYCMTMRVVSSDSHSTVVVFCLCPVLKMIITKFSNTPLKTVFRAFA